MMTKLLNFELKPVVSDIGRDFTMFLFSDAILNAAGFFHDASISNDPYEQYRFIPPPGSTIPASTGATTRNRLLRILNLHVIPKRVLNDLSAEGNAMTIGGEYIGFKDNTIFGSGNVDANLVVNITPGSSKASRNGRVYYVDKLINFSENLVGAHIEKLGTTPSTATSQYNYFWEFLKTSTIWNATTKEITGVSNGSFFTLYIPNNPSIMQAVRDGMLPGNITTGVPNFNSATQTNIQREQVVKFIYHHFLDKISIAGDGEANGSFPTLLKTNLGDAINVFVINTPGSLLLTDMTNRTATTISTPSTYMGNRIVIHLINNYLKYSL
jgi:hypothetical protein